MRSSPPTVNSGPQSFVAPETQRTIEKQLESLSKEEQECLSYLKSTDNSHGMNLTDELALRFALCSPGDKQFNAEAARKVVQSSKKRHLELRIDDMEEQLLTKTLFPVHGLKTKNGNHDVLYMKPARYEPRATATDVIIDNLAYCMNVMLEKEQACWDGIAFVANMNEWKMKNFSVSYCRQFMNMLQGATLPVKVKHFIIVNPPSWFGSIWAIMKPMLTPSFRKTVRILSEKQLIQYLEPGYQTLLPDDFKYGEMPTADLVDEFIAYRKSVEIVERTGTGR